MIVLRFAAVLLWLLPFWGFWRATAPAAVPLEGPTASELTGDGFVVLGAALGSSIGDPYIVCNCTQARRCEDFKHQKASSC